MHRAMWTIRVPVVRAVAAASAGAVGAAASKGKMCHSEGPAFDPFEQMPAKKAPQAFTPKVPYPGWDHNWDYLRLDDKDIAKELGYEWPITDYKDAIRRLFTEHYTFSKVSEYKTIDDVDKRICAREADLPGFFREAFLRYAWGGAPRRFIVLVRHGQYEEKGPRALEKQIEKELGTQQYALDERLQRGAFWRVDAERVLTPLGRQQAEHVGDRLRDLLKPALETVGREADVRIHTSPLTRARETATIIASRLPDHVECVPPNPNLSEGKPCHCVPGSSMNPLDVHVEGSRIEAAFRSIFHRGVHRKPAAGSVAVKSPDKMRNEYDIVVCHGNVIRYFFLRALQLPPEAWLRFGGFNGSMAVLMLNPSGAVCCHCFGDFGHMPLEEVSFSSGYIGLEP